MFSLTLPRPPAIHVTSRGRRLTRLLPRRAGAVPLPSPEQIATAIGAGRVAIGAAFLAAPVFSVRVLGVDTATAKRITFLARMAAARDIAIGAGTLAHARSASGPAWLLAGAAADAADAVVIAAAVKDGSAHGVPAVGIVAGAAGGAALAGYAAWALRRR